MSIFEKKEKNLNDLINKLDVLTSTYSQSSYDTEKLMREHKYLKEKIENLKKEANKQSAMEDKFNQDIEELSQETENLVSEIEKWQT